MKAIKYLLIGFILFSFLNPQSYLHSTECVIICTGPSAYAYHSSNNCWGLNRCSASIESVTLKQAMSMGRRPCKVCGGSPFSCDNPGRQTDECDEKVAEIKEKLNSQINKLERTNTELNKSNSLLSQSNNKLKNDNQKLVRINNVLNSPYKNPDSVLLATYQLLEDKQKFEEQKNDFDNYCTISKKQLDKYHDSLNELFIQYYAVNQQYQKDLKSLGADKLNLDQKNMEFEIRYKNSVEILNNADKINELLNEKYREISSKTQYQQDKEYSLESRERKIAEDLTKIKIERGILTKDIQNAGNIYPERFSFEIVTKPQYCISNSTFKTGALDLSLGLLFRFDANRNLYSNNERLNKFGIVYTYKSELNYKNLSHIGYLQSLNLVFDFKEVLRTGIGYSFLKSQSIQKAEGIINIPFQLFLTRYPVLVGISSNINFNNRFTYLNTEVGICLGIGFDFGKM